MNTSAVTARVHLILARKAPVMAVFRRGPSNQVALLAWNLVTDEITLGQWLKGRIYARRADLSPDGRHLIYFAANHRPQDPTGGSWTAVSRMPHLTALHLYHWGHCWNGGGLFINDSAYWLNGDGTNGPDARVPCGLKRVMTPPKGLHPHMGEDPVTYFPQLLRDGWTEAGRTAQDGTHLTVFRKPVSPGWTLEKTFHAGIRVGRWRECYSETHRLLGPDGTEVALPDAESADTRAGDVLTAERGCLMRRQMVAQGPSGPRLVADLNGLRFTARQADYSGLHKGSPRTPTDGWHPLDRDQR